MAEPTTKKRVREEEVDAANVDGNQPSAKHRTLRRMRDVIELKRLELPPPPPPRPAPPPSAPEVVIRKTACTAISKAVDEEVKVRSLTSSQSYLLDLICKAIKLVITGPAGSGKSRLVKAARRKLRKSTTFFAASTGVAAQAIGSYCKTIESLFGIVNSNHSAYEMALHIRSRGSPDVRLFWETCECLFIEEFWMIPAERFDKYGELAKLMRSNFEDWGGIQLVMTGDHMQLPPVDPTRQPDDPSVYIFNAKCWSRMFSGNIYSLDQNMRQKEDSGYFDFLQRVRLCDWSRPVLNELRALAQNKLSSDNGVEPVHLVCTRSEAVAYNEKRLKELTGTVHKFRRREEAVNPGYLRELLEQYPTPEEVALVVGAQVMFTTNSRDDERIRNGVFGVLVSFEGGIPHVRLPNNETVQAKYTEISLFSKDNRRLATVWHVPLMLCWAMTIHKAQGLTLNKAEIDVSRMFVNFQLYVSLSRVRAKKDVRLIGFQEGKLKPMHDSLRRFMATIRSIVGVKSVRAPTSQEPSAASAASSAFPALPVISTRAAAPVSASVSSSSSSSLAPAVAAAAATTTTASVAPAAAVAPTTVRATLEEELELQEQEALRDLENLEDLLD